MQEYIYLKNENLAVKIAKNGGSILEVEHLDSPLPIKADFVFPVCGAQNANGLNIAGNSYQMDKGGFVGKTEFGVLECYEDYVQMFASSNEDTVAVYPFAFNLLISYKLLGKAIEVNFIVDNLSEYKMPFSAGINLGVDFGGNASQKKIVFSNDEVLSAHDMKNGMIFDGTRRINSSNGNEISFCKGDYFLTENLISDFFEVYNDDRKILGVEFQNAHNLALNCTGKDATFGIWNGLPDTYGKRQDFILRDGTVLLDENSSYEMTFTIIF